MLDKILDGIGKLGTAIAISFFVSAVIASFAMLSTIVFL